MIQRPSFKSGHCVARINHIVVVDQEALKVCRSSEGCDSQDHWQVLCANCIAPVSLMLGYPSWLETTFKNSFFKNYMQEVFQQP